MKLPTHVLAMLETLSDTYQAGAFSPGALAGMSMEILRIYNEQEPVYVKITKRHAGERDRSFDVV